jgi:hypothetical protein
LVKSVLVAKYWKERVACFESIEVVVVVWCVIDEPRAGFCSEWARVNLKKEGGRDETGWVCEVMWCALQNEGGAGRYSLGNGFSAPSTTSSNHFF